MLKCGLLGEKLGHSYSPQIHGMLGDYVYALHEQPPENVAAFLAQGDFDGMNVTIPYKKTVIPCCAVLSEAAQRMGSVNTIVRQSDGTLLGHNTDYGGFAWMVKHSGIAVAGAKILVLGNGGVSPTVCTVLSDMGAGEIVVISRRGEHNYTNLHRHRDAEVIVNTTPVGMYPNNGEAVIDLRQFPACRGVLELIYNPARTKLMLDAETLGIPCAGGLSMLVAQAVEGSSWFQRKEIPDSEIQRVLTTMERQMENIVLIGMPGCGKTTVGTMLAQAAGRTFVDADEELVRQAGKTIPEIFAEEGEDGFRRRETAVLAQLGKRSGLVIATGGGCVTRPENYPLLHQNGRIVWLRRNIADLPTDGRPLSRSGRLEEMYRRRKPLYEAFADAVVENTTPAEAVEKMIGL
jgi:shikimate dehydrogenase